MAGRGKPKQKSSFNLQSFGLKSSDLINTRSLEPPPLYPPLQFKAIASTANDVHNYLIAIKQELRLHLKNSRFAIDCRKKRSCVVKYSDKYENVVNKSSTSETLNDLDAKLFPEELQRKKISKVKKSKSAVDINSKLESLKDEEKEEEKSASEEENEDDEPMDAEKQEEEIEEETDYALSYFDNGEQYLDEADEDEGPTY